MSTEAPRQSWLIRNLVALLIALSVGAVVWGVHLVESFTNVDFLSAAEVESVDQRFRLRGARAPSGDVAIVAIDAKSTEEIGRWPWSRRVHVDLIERLRDWGATTVAFDVLFTEEEGAAEAARLEEVASRLPPPMSVVSSDALARAEADAEPEPFDPTAEIREALDSALAAVRVDDAFALAMESTLDADAALVVLGYDFAFPEDLRIKRELGKVLTSEDEQIVLDIGTFLSRDENVPYLRREPPKLALAIRPVVTTLAEWSAMLGFTNPVYDRDGSLRREQVVVVYSPAVREAFEQGGDLSAALQDPSSRVQAFVPLALSGVATHLRLAVDDMVLDMESGEVRMPVPANGASVERRFRFDRFDGTARIDFLGGAATIPTHSYVDVLEDRLVGPNDEPISGEEAFGGKLVFVGATDPGLGDFFKTPFTTRLPGVEKHANVAENVLSGRQIHTHADPELVGGISVLVAALVVGLVAGNLSAVWAGVGLLVFLAGYLTWTYRDFADHGMLWNWTLPTATVLFGYAAVTAWSQIIEARGKREMQARARFIKNTFGRYLSAEVVDSLVDSPEGLRLGGEKVELTILMSDLRGFTSMCERSTPEQVIGILNHYLGTMANIVLKYQGTVDEFIGDAILALFGAPRKREDDAQRALACAIEMQNAMKQVNGFFRDHGFPEVEMGIALNTGEVIVGNIGSEQRSKYGVVGSNVNLTARIESYTVGGQILISAKTLEAAGGTDVVEIGEKIDVKAKGLKDPIPAFYLLGIKSGRHAVRLEIEEEVLERLPRPVHVRYTVLEGKKVSDETVEGRIVALSEKSGDMLCGEQLPALTNLKLTVLTAEGEAVEGDLYAKVVDREVAEDLVPVRFTSVPPTIKAFFESLTSSAEVA